MAQRQRPEWWHPRASSIGLIVVAIAIGLLFATTARLSAGEDREAPQDVGDSIRSETARLDALEAEVEGLRAEHADLVEMADVAVPETPENLLVASAGTALRGPGLRVELWDAPAVSVDGSAYDVNDLVVHQQDLEAVMNALWAGGAEAMAVQGQRLTMTSSVRCVGNVLLLHGRQYSPPYVIEALGNPTRLRAALDASDEVQIYLQYVDAVRLGWRVTELTATTLPAYTGPATLAWAAPITPDDRPNDTPEDQ